MFKTTKDINYLIIILPKRSVETIEKDNSLAPLHTV